MTRRTWRAAPADSERAKVKRGISPILLLVGIAVLWRWGEGTPTEDASLRLLQFGTGLFALFMSGAYASGGYWEGRAAQRIEEA